MDYFTLAETTMGFLTPHLLRMGSKVAEDGLEAARKKTMEWLKRRFTKPAQVAALSVATQVPDDAEAMEALQHQIKRALEQNEEFRTELMDLLPEEVLSSEVRQSMSVSGTGNVGIQNTGNGSINVSR